MESVDFFKNFWQIFKKSASEFMSDNAIKLSAALSYYTIFALPPLLLIIISLCGVFFGPEAVRGELFGQINGLLGNEAALQIQEMIKNVQLSKDSTFATIIGIIALAFGASGVFAEIQDSINYIWGLKAKPKRGLVKFLFNRLMSFSMIASIGFLMIVSLMINASMDVLSGKLQSYFPDITVHFFYVLNLVLLFAILILLFSIIFKALPDGSVAWKDTIIGAAFTSFLFMIGKSAIGAYLGQSNISSTYGAAGSIILILVWVYYSAIILYFGAEFTKVYAYTFGKKIRPNQYAVHIETKQIELEYKKKTEPVAEVK